MGIHLGAELDRTYAATVASGDEEGRTPKLGDVYYGPGGKAYKFVQFSQGAVAAVLGNIVGYVAETGAEEYEVTADVSATDGVGAGVLMSAPADTELCWVQIKGPATITADITSLTDGNAVTTNGAADGSLAAANADAEFIVAAVMDASARKILCDFPC